ncbi:probable G-protein coupled receptor 139 [Osmerus mordax]|uniref:probable G-protein coupled receptor 139 n=1 Tax=Osmerus mordax TaxID=8014 RepID=UPI00350EF126
MEHSHIFTVASGNESVWSPGLSPPDSPQGCPLGPLPVIYYSALLCLGLPANILTVIILSQLVLRRQKSSYNYLLALAAADILVLLLIVFVDFLLEDFVLGAPLPLYLNKAVQVLEFSSIHTSIWITVPLTVDRYIAVCHPLRYHSVSYPARTRRVITAVYLGCLLSAAPYYWWPELWHGLPGVGGDGESPGGGGGESSVAQHVLVWAHCATVYLLPCAVFFSLNAVIVRKLRRRRNCFRLRGYSTGKTTAILLAITSVFAVLWAPRTLMILYHFYSAPPTAAGPARLLHLLTDVANMLALLNTGVNFFLYCFISKRFRSMAASVLRALFRCRKQPPPFYAGHNFSITSSPWISPANSHCIKMLVYQYDKNGKPVCISP